MPFKSKAQMRYLFSQAPKTAEESSEQTTNPNALPERVNPKGSIKNKPVTPAFKKKAKNTGPLSSFE